MPKKYCQNNSGVSTLIIVAIIVAVIVVAGVVAYVLMSQNSAPGSSEPTSTPQPTSQATASPSPTLTQTPTPSSGQNVSGANSLQFTVSETYTDGKSKVRTIYCKNIGTDNFMLRIESTNTDSSQTIDIAYGGEAWMYMDNEWTDFGGGSNQQMRYNILVSLWQGYVDALTGWSGIGDYSYSQGDTTVRISNISVNPSLVNSLFEHG